MAAPAPPPLQVVFFPFVVPGHMLPMLDLARAFSRSGARATVVTTPATTSAARSHLSGGLDYPNDDPVELVELQLPAAAPPGAIDTHMGVMRMLRDLRTLRKPFQELLRGRRTDCIVSDMMLPWTAEVARELGIQRLVFHGVSVFALCCFHTIRQLNPSPGDTFVVPDLPDRVELAWSELPDFVRCRTAITEEIERIHDMDAESGGVVANSFYGMEGRYAAHFESLVPTKAWLVGPLNLHADGERPRGVDTGGCLTWLDSRPPYSVLYVCFGSLCEFAPEQLREIASGLVASARHFLWVVKSDVGGGEEDTCPWMSEGLRGRIAEGAGLVLRGWAPQRAILGHGAVGGFVTHCGWNSVLEAAAAGVPMLTWPLTAEQFYNEKLVVGVLGLGVPVGSARVWTPGVEGRPVVRAEGIREAVDRLMGEGDEAVELRKRATEMAALARGAVGEGGSSRDDLSRLMCALSHPSDGLARTEATCNGGSEI